MTLAETALVVHADMRRVKPAVVAGAKSAGQAGGEQLGEGITRGVDGKIRDAQGRFVAGGQSVGKSVGRGFEAGFGDTLKKVASVMLSRFVLAGAGAAAAAPGVLQLTAALVPAAGALAVLPAAMLAVKAASATLKVAVLGVGDAIDAGMTGTAEEAEKALQKLPPQARAFARSIIALRPQLEGLRAAVSNRFFLPLNNDMATAASRIIPVMRTSMSDLAGTMGGFGEEVLWAVKRAQTLDGVRALFEYTAQSVVRLRGAVAPATAALSTLVQSTAPFLPGLAAGFANITAKVSEYIRQGAQSGRIVQIIRDGIDTLTTLFGIIGNIASIVRSVMQAATRQGGDMLQVFRDLTGEAASFLRSAQGLGALNAVFGTMAAFGQALRTGLAAALPAVGQSFQVLGPALAATAGPAVELLTAFIPLLPLVAGLAAQVLRFLTPALAALAGWMSQNEDAVRVAAVAIGGFIVAARLAGFAAGVQAAGGLAKWVAQTVVGTSVTKAFTAVQWALGAAMRFALGPIGLVIAGVAALVAGLVYAFRTNEDFRALVLRVWADVQAAAGRVVTWFNETALPFLRRVWSGIADGATVMWRDHIRPALNALIEFFMTKVVPTVTWLWRNVWVPAMKGIGAAVAFAWTDMIRPALEALVEMWTKVIAPTLTWLWKNIFGPAFKAMGLLVQVWWSVVRIVFAAAVAFVRNVLAPVYTWLWKNIVVPAFKAMGEFISATWHNVIRPVLKMVGDFIKVSVAPAFRAGVDAISKAWERLREASRKPVAFVVNQVINPLLHGLRMVGDFFNVKTPDRIPGFARGGLPANGGRIPGAASVVDNMLARGPAGMLKVATGEFITNALSTAANLPVLRVINRKRGRVTAKDLDPVLDGRARGGPIGDGIGDLFGAIGRGLKGAAGMIANPKAALAKVANAAIGRIPGGGALREILVGMGRKAVGWVTTWLEQSLGGGAGGIGSGSPVGGWRGMQRLIAAQFPGLGLISGFRPGSRTLSGRLSYHARGRAVDYPPSRALAAWWRARFGARTKELISPFQELNLLNGRPHRYTGAVWNQHNFAGGNAHVHIAAALGGLIGRLSGGRFGGRLAGIGRIAKTARADFGSVTLARGMNLIENSTGRPEALTAASNANLEALVRKLIDAVNRNPDRFAAAMGATTPGLLREARRR